MRQYLVRVHCCGSRWLVYVPAVELWSFAITKQEIRSVATQMISSATGADSELDLQEGRVLSVPIEFMREHTAAKRWLPSEVSTR